MPAYGTRQWNGLFRVVLRGVLILTATAAAFSCGSSEPTGFPPYPPADDFLAYQEWLRAPRPKPSPQYLTSAKNLVHFERAQHNAELYNIARELQKDRERMAQIRAQEEKNGLWDSLTSKWSRPEVDTAYNEAMTRKYILERRLNDQVGFNMYQQRLHYLHEKKALEAQISERYDEDQDVENLERYNGYLERLEHLYREGEHTQEKSLDFQKHRESEMGQRFEQYKERVNKLEQDQEELAKMHLSSNVQHKTKLDNRYRKYQQRLDEIKEENSQQEEAVGTNNKLRQSNRYNKYRRRLTDLEDEQVQLQRQREQIEEQYKERASRGYQEMIERMQLLEEEAELTEAIKKQNDSSPLNSSQRRRLFGY
ncbi:MAG: hypothetical protein OEZ59_01130 [Deltaproteobacteria bacterium]|nr:hypothetical protein [Deltaproteobacteria bacterium]